MSDQQNRPAPLSYDSELARRANAPRYRPERIASAVAYHAGPEIAVTAVAGGAGAIIWHPAALPVVAALTALYSVVDRLHRRRETGPSRLRTDADVETPAAAESAPESAEGVA